MASLTRAEIGERGSRPAAGIAPARGIRKEFEFKDVNHAMAFVPRVD